MSDSKQGGSEPSMEEILASIRKIISEDTAEDGEKTAAGGDAGSDPASPRTTADQQGPESSPADGGDDVLELSDAAGVGDDADDAPLDLTEEVEAAPDESSLDAEPLELDEQVDGDAEMPGEAGSAARDAGLDESVEADGLAAGDFGAGDQEAGEFATDDEDPAATGAGADQPAAAEAGDEIDETPILADPFDDPLAGAGKPDTAAEAALAAGAMAGTGGTGQAAGQTARQTADAPRSADTASPLGPEDQRVISETAEQQAVEQLTSLARQAENAPGDTTADNVDHILARMVRDALRPQLREWMDRNLPQIVERIVREEVQRMTRRVQGLDDDSRY